MIFPNSRGRAYTVDGFRTLWHRDRQIALDEGSLAEPFTYHDLRAKAGTEAVDWQLLGHRDRRVWDRHYNRKPVSTKPSF